jgi:hypothetical protein
VKAVVDADRDRMRGIGATTGTTFQAQAAVSSAILSTLAAETL